MTITRIFNSSYLRRSVRRAPVIGLALFVLVASACDFGGSQSDSTEVVFSAEVAGNVDIYRIGSDDEVPVRVTSAVGQDFAPAWSPSKEKIAFLSDRNGTNALWVMEANNGNSDSKRQVSAAGVEVVAFRWSPDSNRVGIEIVDGEAHLIEVIDTKAADALSLTSPNENARIGDWSPDGEWLVYAASEGEASGIRRRNPTGVDEITLTIGTDSRPRWSGNGQWIAFNRTSGGGSIDLVVVDKDGNNERVVATGVSAKTVHDWSPDSKHIVYVSETSEDDEIFVVRPDGKDSEQLTSNRVIDAAPVWSSDGASILFLSEGDGSFDVYSMSKDGGQQVRKTTIPDLILSATW